MISMKPNNSPQALGLSGLVGARKSIFLILLILLMASFNVAEEIATDTLDQEKIKSLYLDGDFEPAKKILEAYKEAHPNAENKEKIFIYKFLSVIYAANPKTRDKAQSYMYSLLTLVPTVELLDLYVSDAIEKIFQDVKQKYHREQKYANHYDIYGAPKEDDSGAAIPVVEGEGASSSNSGTQEKEGKKMKPWVSWTLGGVAVATMVTGYMFLSRDKVEKTEKKVVSTARLEEVR